MTKKIETKLFSVTEKVKLLIFEYGKYAFADKLKISKNTLDGRIENHTWTYKEKLIIDELYKCYP